MSCTMSSSRRYRAAMLVMLSKSFADWESAKANFEKQFLASADRALNVPRKLRTPTQDEFAAHLLDVHRVWCPGCPPSGSRARPDAASGGSADAARAPFSFKQNQKLKIFVSKSTQTTNDLDGLLSDAEQLLHCGIREHGHDVNDKNDDCEETIPLSMTPLADNNEPRSDVYLSKLSSEKVIHTKFIKVEVMEVDLNGTEMADQGVKEEPPDSESIREENDEMQRDRDATQEVRMEEGQQPLCYQGQMSSTHPTDTPSDLEKTNEVSALPTNHERDQPDIGCSVNDSPADQRPKERIPTDISGKRFQITRHCEICSASTNDMSKHLERKHKLSKEERQKYILAARNRVPIRRRTTLAKPSSAYLQKRQDCPICDGKNYTSLGNHLEAKHGLDANKVAEIRRKMKQDARSNLKKKNQVSALPTKKEKNHSDIGCSVNESTADERPEERIPIDFSVKRFQMTRRCEICSVSTNDMSKHLERKHKLSKEERQKYILAARNKVPIKRRTTLANPSSAYQQKRRDCPICDGKNYTSIRNHLEGKHRLDPEEVAEILKRMKQEAKSNLKKKNQVSALPTNHERDRPDIGCSVNNSPADQRTEEGIPTDISDFQSVRERTNQVSDVSTNHEQGADIGCIVNDSTSEQRPEERIPFDLSVKRFRITRRCEICSASTNDMSKHLERKHKLSKEERQKYILAARGRVPIQRRTTLNNPSGVNAQKRQDCPICGGKNYTYLRNHLEGKHGLDPDQVAEIRKRMKQEKKKTC